MMVKTFNYAKYLVFVLKKMQNLWEYVHLHTKFCKTNFVWKALDFLEVKSEFGSAKFYKKGSLLF